MCLHLCKVFDVVGPHLLIMINHCLETDFVPDLLKYAIVHSLLKKQNLNPAVLAHFRPFSNLSFVLSLRFWRKLSGWITVMLVLANQLCPG